MKELAKAETIDILKKAKELVVNNYCSGWFAKDAEGYDARTDSKDAVTFCSAGALLRFGYNDSNILQKAAEEILRENNIKCFDYGQSVVILSDNHRELIPEMFDRSIKNLESE